MRFIDSHLHVPDGPPPSQAVRLCQSTQTLLLVCGVDHATSEGSLRLAASHTGLIRPFVGLHPSEVAKAPETDWVEGSLGASSGLGEVGMDPRYGAPKETQRRAFERQLAAAERARKPVQVHSRGAEEECLEVLSTYDLPAVLMHWFQREDLVGKVAGRGYFVSFGPALLSSKALKRMALSAGKDLTLTETDAPVHFSSLGGAQGPQLIPSVVFELALLWREPFESARLTVLGNGLRFLGEEGKVIT